VWLLISSIGRAGKSMHYDWPSD